MKMMKFPRSGITLKGDSGWSDEPPEKIYVDLRSVVEAEVGKTWEALNPSNVVRDSVDSVLTKVHRRVAILRKEMTADSPSGEFFVEETIYVLPESLNIEDVEALEG